MARFSDLSRVVASVGVLGFAKRVWGQIVEDNLFTLASALAYSWLFAIFPFLIFLLSLLPYLPERYKEQAKEEIDHLVHQLPENAAQTIWQNVTSVLERPKNGLLIVGLGVAVWAASGGMSMTMGALDKCYELEQGRPFYKQRPLAMLLTLAVATLILMVVVLLPIGAALKLWLIKRGYINETNIAWVVLFDFVRWALALTFMITSLTLVYHFGPSVKHRFHWVTPGSAFCVLVWILLGLVFRVYVQKFGRYEQTYGTVGGVAVLLLFFYVDSLVLLIGAEINSEIDFEVLKVKRGTRDFRPAETVVETRGEGTPSLANIAAEQTDSAAPAADEGVVRT